MTNMTFDISKCKKDENGHLIARTRSGENVLIFCTNAPGPYPLVGQVGRDIYQCARWTANGRFLITSADDAWDLINVPAEHVVTVFLYCREGIWYIKNSANDVSWEQMFGPGFQPGPNDSRKVITISEGEGLL